MTFLRFCLSRLLEASSGSIRTDIHLYEPTTKTLAHIYQSLVVTIVWLRKIVFAAYVLKPLNIFDVSLSSFSNNDDAIVVPFSVRSCGVDERTFTKKCLLDSTKRTRSSGNLQQHSTPHRRGAARRGVLLLDFPLCALLAEMTHRGFAAPHKFSSLMHLHTGRTYTFFHYLWYLCTFIFFFTSFFFLARKDLFQALPL